MNGDASSSMVAKAKRNGYLNFTQAWRRAYTGPQQSPQEMIRQAASAWRNLSVEDRQPFHDLAEQERARRLTATPLRRSRRLQEQQLKRGEASRRNAAR